MSWKRRPDLNRGWRFCRFSGKVYLIDSSCFPVSAKPSFYLVFGLFWTQVGPEVRRGLSWTFTQPRSIDPALHTKTSTLTTDVHPIPASSHWILKLTLLTSWTPPLVVQVTRIRPAAVGGLATVQLNVPDVFPLLATEDASVAQVAPPSRLTSTFTDSSVPRL